MLRIADLHPAYATATPEDTIRMANLGAECWATCRETFHADWSSSMSAEDSKRAEMWRAEGRLSAIEEMSVQLAAAGATAARLATAEGTIASLHSSIEAEVARRLEEALKDHEIASMRELMPLREKVAVAAVREEMLAVSEDLVKVLQEKVATLEAATAPRTSNTLGRQGESHVQDLLENVVCKQFPHAEVRDMTKTPHAADFHLWLAGHHGQRVKILVDAKKYRRPVSSDEVTKLYGDVDADDEAHCGLLISVDSPVSTKRQFWVGRTPRQKPVLFLTFQDLSSAAQQELICWAVHVLAEFVDPTTSNDSLSHYVESLLDALNSAVRDIDGILISKAKALADLRGIRERIMLSILEFRKGRGEEVTAEDGCSATVKATGLRCGRRVVEDGRCGNHRVGVPRGR